MTMRFRLSYLFGLATVALLSGADNFYLGTWKIVSAVPGPWAVAAYKEDAAAMKALMGKSVTITPKAITGPRDLGCAGAHYQVKDYGPDMLFQGAFGEMHERNKTADPAKLAASVGFHGSHWKTLETGCEIDYHFIDPTTAAIGLNNYVYIFKKQ
jgi:hypothetical protein